MKVENGEYVDTGELREMKLIHMIFSRENLLALLICLALILILIMTSDQAPQWIYQGF